MGLVFDETDEGHMITISNLTERAGNLMYALRQAKEHLEYIDNLRQGLAIEMGADYRECASYYQAQLNCAQVCAGKALRIIEEVLPSEEPGEDNTDEDYRGCHLEPNG